MLGPTQATCYWWAAPPATCLLHSLLLREEQAQNTFAFAISTQGNLSLLLLPSSTQGRRGGNKSVSYLGCVFFFQGKESALLFELFWICFLTLPAISHDSSRATHFHPEGLSPAGWGVHCIHFRRVSVHLALTTAYLWQLWLEPGTKSCFLQGSAAKAEQFSRLDEASTGGPSKSHRDPLSRCHVWSPWCINQPQDYDESPVQYRHETR